MNDNDAGVSGDARRPAERHPVVPAALRHHAGDSKRGVGFDIIVLWKPRQWLVDGWTNGWMDGWMAVWTDGQIHKSDQ